MVPFLCSNYVLSYVQDSDWDACEDDGEESSSRRTSPRTSPRKSPRKSPKKSMKKGVKDKGEGKNSKTQDWESSMAILAKSQAETAETNRQVRILIDMVRINY